MDDGSPSEPHPIAIAEVTGDAYARGRAHGAALAPLVRAHVNAWLGSLEDAGLGDAQEYVRAFLQETDFRSAITRFAPDLLEEVKGIAEGSGADTSLIYALQLMDEEWFFRGRREAPEKCSTVGILASGATFIGQNMDLGSYTDGFQSVLAITGGREALVFTTAGLIGLMGVNGRGVGVCVNSLPQLGARPEGIPVAFMLRRLLQAASLDEAADLVQSLPHATNQHYAIAEKGRVRSFESSADGVREYQPPDASRLLHTNHVLAGLEGRNSAKHDYLANSMARLRSLEQRLERGPVGGEEIKAALCSCDDPQNPVCRIPKADAGLVGFTTGSMISRLNGRSVESWISAGPPRERGYHRFELRHEP